MYFHPHNQGYFIPTPEQQTQDFRQFPGGGGFPGGGFPGGGFPGGGFPGGGTGQVDRRLDRLERQVERLNNRVDRLDRRVSRIERQLGIRDEY